MGRVYRALDLQRGVPVAVKLMIGLSDPVEVARFGREAEVLAQLDHSGIVAYIAHGHSDQGEPFLVMEWLDGEDLAERLRRQRLTAQETLILVRRIAQALDAAHERGVVHRDLKPGNIFLRGGAVDRVTLVDFGIARQSGIMPSLTRVGGLIGTPGYIAPEQVRGLRSVGKPADIFALGCVLFECLTGRPPFAGPNLAASLAQVLFDPTPQLSEERPDLPAALGTLLADMLVKDPNQRIQTARELVARLSALPALGDAPAPVPEDTRTGLGDLEQRLVNVIIASPLVALAEQATVDEHHREPEKLTLIAKLTSHGARVEEMGDGSLVATLALEHASAVDHALQAVELARVIRAQWPESVVALATGRGVFGSDNSLGEALTRAGALLPQAATLSTQHPTARILLEDVTAALVAARVRTVRLASGVSTLHEDAVTADTSRPLLGKPTPCLGREQEIGTLEMALRSTLDEGSAHAILVTGPPGIGKSRIRHEFLRRVATTHAEVVVLTGGAEAGQAASAHGLLGSVLRRHLGVRGDLEERRAHLHQGVARYVGAEDVQRVSEFLGEVCGVPFDAEHSIRLRAARQDPRILRDQVATAWVDFLRAECRAHPVLLLIEDLHWGDRASADLVDVALRQLEDQPLMVVAFARPEVTEHLPGLWKGRAQELPLRPLGRRACEQLVAQVLGDSATAALASRIVEQAAGNPLFLEELIRAAADGKADRLPATVLAMLQARIGRLDAELRRVLRAASVFGASFFSAGVQALLGPGTTAEETHSWLRELQQHEILEAQRETTGDEAPLRFRHALMREAAYSLLLDADRTLGHRLAAAFLERHQGDAAIIASHFVRGDQGAKAIPWFLRAAEHAFDRDEHVAASELAIQAMDCAPEGEELGKALAMEAMAGIWSWDWTRSLSQIEKAQPLLPVGGVWWSRAMYTRSTLLAYQGTPDHGLAELCEAFAAVTPLPGADNELAYAAAAANIASGCTQVGLTSVGYAMLARAEAVLGSDDERYPSVGAWRHLVRCTCLRHTNDDLALQLQEAAEGLRLYVQAGASVLMRGVAQDVLGEVLCRSGDFDAGLPMLRESVEQAKQHNLEYLQTHARQCLANSLVLAGSHADARRVADTMLENPAISVGFQAMARHVVAQADLAQGKLVEAETAARAAIALSPHTPIRRLQMTATLVEVLVRADRAAEACATADAALQDMSSYDGGGYAELALLLAAAKAHDAVGDRARGQLLARRAWDKLQDDARGFDDAGARERFLTAVPVHAEIRALAESASPADPGT